MEIKKVYGDYGGYTSQLQETAQRTQDQSAAQTAQTQQTGDKVALSPEARLLATTLNAASSAPDVRADKVRELKEQVQSGTYKPDIKKAAANLLRDEGNLIR